MQPPYDYICKICQKPRSLDSTMSIQISHPILSQVPSNYICHKCGLPGHWIENCPCDNMVMQTPPSNYIFNKCGISGHWIKDCKREYSIPPPDYLCTSITMNFWYKLHFVVNMKLVTY